ncbi:uncharacterized protein G2W53_001631 [Senna tora]|uniref:Uncharacterized protein n=1 Tax=Senna tora TaxID=362788 RepID=A0A835CKH4_9FABA|nr:uncharacterized protein G2W53_001631 [Senna tora]
MKRSQMILVNKGSDESGSVGESSSSSNSISSDDSRGEGSSEGCANIEGSNNDGIQDEEKGSVMTRTMDDTVSFCGAKIKWFGAFPRTEFSARRWCTSQ